jgi:hypothetical protein
MSKLDRSCRLWLPASLLIAALALAMVPARAAGVLAAYTVLGPDGPVARAIVDGGACPALEVDGRPAPMRVRAAADRRFPLICEALLPAGAAAARIGDAAVPVLAAEVRRIAIFGDSGCRVDAKAGDYQACNDPAQWPFAGMSATAAALVPDLVIHVGDYLYRESPCPQDVAGCTGSPAGDDWPAWQADFFAPAAKLLRAAPWVMVRGNHENCDRAGLGFFRLLDPRPLPQACLPISPVYRVAAGSLVFFVLDSGEANDTHAPADLVEVYRQQFAGISGAPGAWLLTHRPVWGVVRVSNRLGMSILIDDNVTLQTASANALPPAIALVVSGHIHLFEALSFVDHRPPQLVIGTAGSSLSEAIATDLVGHAIAGTYIAYGRTLHEFGVTTMERAGAGWTATLHDESGAARFTCTIEGSNLGCAP